MLEDKIKEYLLNDTANAFPEVCAKQAHDITEIFNQEYESLAVIIKDADNKIIELKTKLKNKCDECWELNNVNADLEKENSALKSNFETTQRFKDLATADVERLIKENAELKETIRKFGIKITTYKGEQI